MLILSFLVSVVVFLIKQIWPFIILGLAIGFWATGRFQPARGGNLAEQKKLKRVRAFFQSFVVILPGVVYLFGSYITNPLIYYAGIESTGKVISQEETRTLHNYKRIMKMNVAFLKADGTLQKSSFRTDEFNLYPGFGRVTYPRPGQEFKLRYLPSIPRYFVIQNNVDTDFHKLQGQKNELEGMLDIAPADAATIEKLSLVETQLLRLCN